MPTPLPWLTERAPDSSKLDVDEAAAVIKGVRVCGRFSKNNHGLPGVTEGTEYTAGCHETAKALYEGREVFCDHVIPGDRKTPTRSVHDTFGVLRNVRPVQEAEGTVTRADLHYLPDHPVAKNVVHSVRHGLGLFGLSHHAKPASAKVVNGRYVVERLERVESVDLVNRPATSRNLMESQTVTKKLREVLEEQVPKSGKFKDHLDALKALLEMDDAPMAGAMDTPVDSGDSTSSDPDQATDDAFKQAATAQIEAYFSGTLTAAEMFSKLKALFKAHGKLSGDAGGDDGGDGSDSSAPPSTESQEELRSLRAKVTCFEAKIEPTPLLLKTLGLIESEADRKALLAELRPAADSQAPPASRPKSSAPMPQKKAGATQESQEAPKDAKDFARRITVTG
jgi:hypothetical protein